MRRRDPVWGADAAAANFDTFSYANAAPQVNVFNQSKDLWLGLEDYLLGFADAGDERVTVASSETKSSPQPILPSEPPHSSLIEHGGAGETEGDHREDEPGGVRGGPPRGQVGRG